MHEASPEKARIRFRPAERVVEVDTGKTLLEAARAAGIEMVAVCGGIGACDTCRVRHLDGPLSPPTLDEEAAFTPVELEGGARLGCQAVIHGDAEFEVPPESLTAPQRLQLEGIAVGFDPAGSSGGRLGLAFDVGTTKLAGYLVDLDRGVTLARAGALNPQATYGEDVVSRIAYANEAPDNADELRTLLEQALDLLVQELSTSAGVEREQIAEGVVVGNTAMHHLLLGLPVRQLGEAPYEPVTTDPVWTGAEGLGLRLSADANFYLPPIIAGYVGADHVAMAVAADVWTTSAPLLAIDIGTNTEISLARENSVWSCSCASGPAFEGAHIRDGMRARAGAIERIQVVQGALRLHTIGERPPVGICGSGILDAVAALRTLGVLDEKGALRSGVRGARPGGTLKEYVLADASSTGHGREVAITRSDVHEVQLAKAAIRAGIDALLETAGVEASALEQVVVAGAFGTYLDVRSAISIGMFPPLPVNRFRQVGNAAGTGAVKLLLRPDLRDAVERDVRKVRYVELATSADFQEQFIKSLFL